MEAVNKINFWVIVPAGSLGNRNPRVQGFRDHITDIQKNNQWRVSEKKISAQSGILVVNDSTSKSCRKLGNGLEISGQEIFPVRELVINPVLDQVKDSIIKGFEFVFENPDFGADLAITIEDSFIPIWTLGLFLDSYLKNTWDLAVAVSSKKEMLADYPISELQSGRALFGQAGGLPAGAYFVKGLFAYTKEGWNKFSPILAGIKESGGILGVVEDNLLTEIPLLDPEFNLTQIEI